MTTTVNASMRARTAVSVVALVLLSAAICAAETVVDDAHGFTLTLPDGFAAVPKSPDATPNVIHIFVLGDPGDDELDIMLFIEKMRGTIGRERLTLNDMPPGFQGRLLTMEWQGFEVDVFEVPESVGEIDTVTYNIQIPLKRAAIQLKLFGPVDRQVELERLRTEIVAGVQGDSNWIQSAAPTSPVASHENYGVVLLAAAIGIVLGGLVVLYLYSKIAPKGAVLGVAVVIYMAGWAFSGIRIREVIMLVGAMKMLGFAGGILGLWDSFRKRKSPVEDAKT